MTASQLIFYAISAVVLGAGMLAVTATKIFRAAIWLLFSLTGVAGLYFWMQVEFIAAVQIVVYVGGIVVLIIFSIFLTQDSGRELPKLALKQKIFAALAALSGLLFSYHLIGQYNFRPRSTKPFVVSVSNIGTEMLSPEAPGFILPFEVVSILLLAAMVGCIVIAMKHGEKEATETLAAQVDTNTTKPPAIVTIKPFTEPYTIEEEAR